MWSFDPGSPITAFPALTGDPYLLSSLIYALGIGNYLCEVIMKYGTYRKNIDPSTII